MNGKSLWIPLFWAFEALTLAQQPQLPVPPTAPFVKSLPSHAEWRIEYVYDNDTSKTANNAPVAPAKIQTSRRIIKIEVTKADANRHEVASWSDGATSETWIYRNWVLISTPDSTDIRIMDRVHLSRVFAEANPDYAQGDFANLDWLSLDNFTGVQTVQNRPCYVFKRKGSSSVSTEKAASEDVEASIDGQTGWPVEINRGAVHQIYSYPGEVPADLELPERFATALANYQVLAAKPYTHKMK